MSTKLIDALSLILFFVTLSLSDKIAGPVLGSTGVMQLEDSGATYAASQTIRSLLGLLPVAFLLYPAYIAWAFLTGKLCNCKDKKSCCS